MDISHRAKVAALLATAGVVAGVAIWKIFLHKIVDSSKCGSTSEQGDLPSKETVRRWSKKEFGAGPPAFSSLDFEFTTISLFPLTCHDELVDNLLDHIRVVDPELGSMLAFLSSDEAQKAAGAAGRAVTASSLGELIAHRARTHPCSEVYDFLGLNMNYGKMVYSLATGKKDPDAWKHVFKLGEAMLSLASSHFKAESQSQWCGGVEPTKEQEKRLAGMFVSMFLGLAALMDRCLPPSRKGVISDPVLVATTIMAHYNMRAPAPTPKETRETMFFPYASLVPAVQGICCEERMGAMIEEVLPMIVPFSTKVFQLGANPSHSKTISAILSVWDKVFQDAPMMAHNLKSVRGDVLMMIAGVVGGDEGAYAETEALKVMVDVVSSWKKAIPFMKEAQVPKGSKSLITTSTEIMWALAKSQGEEAMDLTRPAILGEGLPLPNVSKEVEELHDARVGVGGGNNTANAVVGGAPNNF